MKKFDLRLGLVKVPRPAPIMFCLSVKVCLSELVFARTARGFYVFGFWLFCYSVILNINYQISNIEVSVINLLLPERRGA